MKPIYIILFSVFAFLMITCQSGQPERQNLSANGDPDITTVEVVNPSLGAFTTKVLITGKAMPNQKVTLHSMESGFVKNIRKDIGDFVQKGDVIAVLENPELVQLLKRAEADLSQANAALLKAQATLSKMQAVEKASAATASRLNAIFQKTPSLTPIDEVERVQAAAASAKADVNIAEADIEAAHKGITALTAVKDAVALRNEMLFVKAPFSGLVTKRYVDNGAAIQSGLSSGNSKPIVEIQEVNPIRLTIPLPESDAVAIQEGMEATITFPKLPGESFTTKVSRTAKSIDFASGTMQVEIDIANPKSLIMPGMYAKVSLEIESRKDVLSLPLTAQVIYQDEFFLLVVKDKKVERLLLKKGLSGKDFFEVLNTDISESSQVIVQGKNLVRPGQIVEPILKMN